MKTPYLIQRMTAEKVFNPNSGIDANYNIDYMGSAEFEFGALPKSLSRMCEIDDLTTTIIKTITNFNDEVLRVISKTKLSDEYIKSLTLFRDNNYNNTKEMVYLKENSENKDISRWQKVDVWWDIENDLMFCYGKQTFKNLQTAISNVKSAKGL